MIPAREDVEIAQQCQVDVPVVTFVPANWCQRAGVTIPTTGIPFGKDTSGEASVIRVLLVDDHEIVRRGIADLIGTAEDLEVVGEASSVTEALPEHHR
jgi:hypothetical protein